MPPVARLDPRTASPAQSIWRDVSEDEFRRHIIALQEISSDVPADPEIHSAVVWQEEAAHHDSRRRLLPFDVEHRLADDLAFIAAAKEDPKAVSAAIVEEASNGAGLSIRLAANDGILREIAMTFRVMCHILSRCAGRRMKHDYNIVIWLTWVIRSLSPVVHERALRQCHYVMRIPDSWSVGIQSLDTRSPSDRQEKKAFASGPPKTLLDIECRKI